MNTQSRIPKLNDVSFDGALLWFSEMKCRDLLFHPDDDPATLEKISDGTPSFTAPEIEEVRFIIDELDAGIGHDQVIEAAYPIAMHAMGIMLDA